MKKLIIVRHGDCGVGGHMSPKGNKEMQDLAEKILPIVEGYFVVVISSTMQHVKDSAMSFCRTLGISAFKDSDALNSEKSSFSLELLMELVEENKDVDILVLITHQAVAYIFPTFFCFKRFRKSIGHKMLERGEAIVIDCESEPHSVVYI